MVQQDLRGELTSQEPTKFEMSEGNFIKALSDAFASSSQSVALKHALYPTLMCYAANMGYKATFQELKENGADINGVDFEGNTPLHVAAKKGQLAVVEYLIEQGANVNAQDKQTRTPLWYSATNFHKDVSKLLIKAKAKLLGPYDEMTQHLMK